MNLFTAIILGIVEGITEFLPVSSTGHLILTSSILRIPPSEFLKTFEISIQLGAILSVVVLYWKSLVLDMGKAKKVMTAFVPTALIGLIFYKSIKTFLLGSKTIVVWSLLFGGIFIVIFELWYQRKTVNKSMNKENGAISYKQAFLVGLMQSVSMIPGVSRSAATILGGLVLGVGRKTIVEFSFLLAVPTMAAAAALDLSKTAGSFTGAQVFYLIVGFIVSFIAAMAAIKFLLSFIKNNNFIVFGIYRIILALLFLCLAVHY